MKSGFVSLIGRSNVGKSTLINQLVSHKIAITSNKSQTTRNIIQGVYNDKETQIVFIDTPGIHKPINKLGKIMNKQSSAFIHDVDVIYFLVDASVPYGKGDQFIIDKLKDNDIPIILVLNKIDKISNEEIIKKINEYKDLLNFTEIIPVSAIANDNIDHLIEITKKYLTDEVKYFDDETVTSNSKYFMISEFVREQLLRNMNEEIPHSIACVTTSFEETSDLAKIGVDIIVDRDPLKKIVIGKNGNVLKTIGIEARKIIEEMLGKKVYLELYVKTIKNWRDKEKQLKELGFNEYE